MNDVEYNDTITRAITSLKASVSKSNLPDSEKKALATLLEKVDIYYKKRLNIILKKNNNGKELNTLQILITDILVEINSVLIGNNDIYYFVSVVNKKLHDKDINQLITNHNKRK